MSAADLQELEEVKGLIARGLQVGVLTYAEIASATAELGLEETDVGELHDLFERSEIELVEDIDPAIAASLNIERAPEQRTRRKAPLDLRPEGTTDGLQLFLKGIGKVRLLTAQEEVDLAKRIWRGRLRRQAEDGRVQPAPRRFDREELPQPGTAVPRPDPGGDWGWSGRPRSSTTARGSSSRPTPRGGSGRRSRVLWLTRRGRSASRSTSSRSSTRSAGRSASWSPVSAASRRRRRSPM